MSKILLLLALTTTVFANDQYHLIDSIEIVEVVESQDGYLEEVVVSTEKVAMEYADYSYAEFKKATDPVKNPVTLGKIIEQTEEIVALGEDIYTLVQKGKPNVNIDSAPISVLPMNSNKTGPMSTLDMSNWKEPMVKKFRIKTKNYLGATTVDFAWKVIFSYGGQLDGNGAFITGASIKPEHIKVLFGYDLTVNYSLQSISNTGTRDFPIAQAVIDLDFKIETVLQTTMKGQSYLISGQGNIKTL